MADLPDPLAVTHLDDYLRSQRPSTSELSKWPVRLLSRVTSVCVHQTAVPGGFGVKDFQIAAAMRERPDTTLDLLVQGLLWRYRKTPYHAVYSPRRRVSVVQWHPKWRTNHGNGSNRYSIGWAYDGGFTTHHTDVLDVVGGRESLTRVVETMRKLGCPLRYIEAHRQHSDDRADDPGNEIWSGIVIPVAQALGLELRETFTTGSGKAIPETWHG